MELESEAFTNQVEEVRMGVGEASEEQIQEEQTAAGQHENVMDEASSAGDAAEQETEDFSLYQEDAQVEGEEDDLREDGGDEGDAAAADDEVDEPVPSAPLEPSIDPSTIKRPLSAWMHFLADHREQVRLENPDKKIGERQKILSAKWNALQEGERAKYDAIAAADKERFAAELKSAGLTKLPSANNGGSSKDKAVHPAHTTTITLPLARIKKAVKLDPDVKNVSKEGLCAIAKATELFLAQLGERSWGIARQTGRRTVRPTDLTEYIGQAQEMYFVREEIRDVIEEAAAAAAAAAGAAAGSGPGNSGGGEEGGGSESAGPARKGRAAKVPAEPAKGRAAITSFFGRAPLAGNDTEMELELEDAA